MKLGIGAKIFLASGCILAAELAVAALLVRGAHPGEPRVGLAIAFGVGLANSVGVAIAATALVRRAIRRLADSAARAAGGVGRAEVDPDRDIGEVHQVIHRMADAAERTHAELRTERRVFGSVLDAVTQGVIALDSDRRMTMISPAARTILELPPIAIGDVFIDQIRIPAAVALIEDAIAHDVAATAEFTTPAGIRVLARASAHRSSTGTGCILVVDDVTAIRRLETIRSDFVANVSHELRTPVSVIRANAETLIGGAKDDPKMADRLMNGLHRNAERLSRIITDLLDLSRIEAGQMAITSEPIAVASAVQQARSAIEAQAAARPVEITIQIADEIAVQADPKALDQVLVNLLENAVKYTGAGAHVWVRAHRRDDRVRIEVADDGPGIAPHHRERVFERFYRVDAGRSRELGGTGLGLSIVKHLVESQGGDVGVEANDPCGSVFWFDLPAAPVVDH